MTRVKVSGDLLATAHRIGVEVAAPAAAAVDRDARFPHEAITALRKERMLGAYIPEDLGGRGCSIGELAAVCQALGRHCTSTAMVYAMHQIQVGCLVRHARTEPWFRGYLSELADREGLIASATSELGVGGDVRRSVCAVERTGTRFRIQKHAPVISYGEHADDILVTARRAPHATASDQVLVLVRKPDTALVETSGWDSLGMRGTCSLGYTLTATGAVEQVLTVPYAEISSQTMLPFSHILWGSLWLGIATDAVQRARAFVRAEARKQPGAIPTSAHRLAEVVSELGAMHALGVCGLAGYKADSPYALGRHLRDVHSAPLMIGNDRIYAVNAALLLVEKGD